MAEYFHSVTLDTDMCKGCTNCIKLCPTSAIRVRGGKAKITKERCIDCGECIRVCPYHAKKAITDPLECIQDYQYKIALPAPSLYGQFKKAASIDAVLEGLIGIGFDDVFEVAKGAEIVAAATKLLFSSGELLRPVISSACPAVLRLISVRFPNLIGNVIPLQAPLDVAARIAKDSAAKRTGIDRKNIGVFFISPCAAKATAVKSPIGIERSEVDGVISMKDIFRRLSAAIAKAAHPHKRATAGCKGVGWALSEGESHAIGSGNFIAVDGIANCIKLLEEIDNGKLQNVDFIELSACEGGCVGGALTVENPYIAKNRISTLLKSVPCEEIEPISEKEIQKVLNKTPILHKAVMNLDTNIIVAMHKIEMMEKIYQELPQIDCGACGAPDCKAHAEDIVRGLASETDCIFKLREKVRALAAQMMEIESHMPPSLDRPQSKEKDDE